MPFRNYSLTKNGQLTIGSIFSPGFEHLLAGWQISKDGSAEFNDLTVRGTFHGIDFVLNSDGIFFYSSIPAAGNMIGSWANAAGTDEFGNAYVKGIAIGVVSNTEIQIRPDLDAILIYES